MTGSYVGATEVTLILPAPVSIGTNTGPLTLSEVASAIQRHGARVNVAAAGAGYAVPVSPSALDAYSMIQDAVIQGVAGWIMGIYGPNVPAGPGSTLAGQFTKAYEDFLEQLRDGDILLPDVGRDTDGRQLPRSFETTNTAAAASVGGASPLISVKQVF